MFAEQLANAVKRELKDPRFQSLERHRNGIGGRVFYVLKAAATNYTQFVEDHPDYKSADGVVTAASVYNTVNAAIGACTADQGDYIYVMPGHTETVTTTSIAMNIAGVTIQCLGNGKGQGLFTYSATGSTITVSAANMSFIGGFHVPAAGIAVVSAFTVGAATDFLLKNGTFEDASSTGAFTSLVTTGATTLAANGLSVVGNYHMGLATSPAATISILGNTDRFYAGYNWVDSAATNDIGHFITIAALVLRAARIEYNRLNVVGSTGAAVGVFMTGSSTTNTGMVCNNFVTCLDTTGALLVTATINLAVHENYFSGVVASSGAVWPVADNPA